MATLEAALLAEFGPTIFEDWRSKLPDLKIPDVAPDGYAKRDLRAITAISIHHAAGSATTTPDVIHRFHQSSNGPNAPQPSPGIAYHLYLYLVGKVWKAAYVGDIGTIRWHTSSNNFYTVGICAGGNYEQEKPPWEVVNLLQRCIVTVKAALKGSVLGVWQHRAFPNTSTSCPGKLGDGDVWLAVLQVPAPKPPPNPYSYALGFLTYSQTHDIGAPIENEWTTVDPTGKKLTLQRTAKGILTYTSEEGIRFGKY